MAFAIANYLKSALAVGGRAHLFKLFGFLGFDVWSRRCGELDFQRSR